jgi:hypothetical protein
MKLVTIVTALFALQLTDAQNLRAQHRGDFSVGFSSAAQNFIRGSQGVVVHHENVGNQIDFPALVGGGSQIGLNLPDPCECECSLNGDVGIIHVTSSGNKNVEQEIRCVPPDLSSWALKTKRYECVHCGERVNV